MARVWRDRVCRGVCRAARQARAERDGEEAEEPKPILLWRPARFEQRPRHQRQDNRQRRGQRGGAPAADGARRRATGRVNGDRPQRSERSAAAGRQWRQGAFRARQVQGQAERRRASGREPPRQSSAATRRLQGQAALPGQAAARRAAGAYRPGFALRQARRAARPTPEVDARRRPAAHRQMAVLRARGQVALAGAPNWRSPGVCASTAKSATRPRMR